MKGPAWATDLGDFNGSSCSTLHPTPTPPNSEPSNQIFFCQVARTLESAGRLKQGGPMGPRRLLPFPLSASPREFYAVERGCLMSMVWVVVP